MEPENQYLSQTDEKRSTINELETSIGELVKKSNKLKKVFLLFFGILTISCTLFVHYTWTTQKNTTNQRILRTAESFAFLLDDETLKNLKALPEDEGTMSYKSIKARLLNIIKLNKDIRFAYLYTQRNNKIYFMVDSEPAGSVDLSPPGQLYDEEDPFVSKPFIDGRSIITEPTTDRWGEWISVLVSIKTLKRLK
jgi:hypothetical protein